MVSSIDPSTGFYVMGDTFIRNYYTVFDYKELTVSFAPATHSPEYGNLMTGWDIFGIVIACFTVVILTTFLVVYLVRKFKKPNLH